MGRIRARVSDDLKDALTQVCDHMNVTESMVIRGHARDVIEKHAEAVDDDTLFKAKSDYVKSDHKAYQQALHLPNNLHEELQTQLREKRFPMHPEEVYGRWYTPYKEIVELGLDGESKQRKLAQLTHTIHQYSVLHYSVETPDWSRVDAAVNFAGTVLVDEGKEEAKAFIGDLVDANMLPDRRRDETFDALNDLATEQWRGKWKEALKQDPYDVDDLAVEGEA